MNVNADIVSSQKKDVLTLPADVIERGDLVLVKAEDAKGLEVVEVPGTKEGYAYVKVEIGISDGTAVEIKSGIHENTKVYKLAKPMKMGPQSFNDQMQDRMSQMERARSMPSGGFRPSGGATGGATGGASGGAAGRYGG